MARIAGVEVEIAETSVLRRNPRPSVWLDTCVFLDFWSEISINKNRAAGQHSIDATRESMQNAAWLALAFDECGTRTVTFMHEAWDNNMKEKAAPDSSAGAFSATVAHVVLDAVCPAWNAHIERAGATVRLADGPRNTTNDERDQLTVDLCREYGLQLVSTDGGALRRARTANVTAYKPAEYAARVISRQDARQRFLTRLEPGLAAWHARHPNEPRRDAAVSMIRDIYQGIWEPV